MLFCHTQADKGTVSKKLCLIVFTPQMAQNYVCKYLLALKFKPSFNFNGLCGLAEDFEDLTFWISVLMKIAEYLIKAIFECYQQGFYQNKGTCLNLVSSYYLLT